jgi:hypothetical protein
MKRSSSLEGKNPRFKVSVKPGLPHFSDPTAPAVTLLRDPYPPPTLTRGGPTNGVRSRLLTRRAYGFHTATAALALIMLTSGPITLMLPHEDIHLHV